MEKTPAKFIKQTGPDWFSLAWLVGKFKTQSAARWKEFCMTIRVEAHCISPVHGLITRNQVQELSSKQEEADAKILLCDKFAASLGFESASITAVDSDVAILSIYSQHRLDLKLYLRMGTGSKEKIFDI